MKTDKNIDLNYIRYLSGVISEDRYYEMDSQNSLKMFKQSLESYLKQLDEIEQGAYHIHDVTGDEDAANFQEKISTMKPVLQQILQKMLGKIANVG
jgi:hypothetical protein